MKKILTTKGKLNRFFNSRTLPSESSTTLGSTTPDNQEIIKDALEEVPGTGDGIYGGSGTIAEGETTIVTIPSGSELKIGNTTQSSDSIRTDKDANHWGTYNG